MTQMSDGSMLRLVKNAIDEVLDDSGRERSRDINSQTRLRADLDLDSLDLAVLTVKLEAKTGVDVFIKGIVTTVGELVSRIDEQ